MANIMRKAFEASLEAIKLGKSMWSLRKNISLYHVMSETVIE